ncbi:MAG: carbohydrate binding domain-containing protein [Limisphaerales bacterium]
MTNYLLFTCICFLTLELGAAPRFADRFVWISGWGLQRDADVAEISKVLVTAHTSHFNGAVVSFGLDALDKASPDFFRRLDEVSRSCEENRLELIPAIFSVGRGDGVLAHDRNLAEGLPVEDALFLVQGGEGRLAPTSPVQFKNGGFEEFDGNAFKGYAVQDQPGEISFADTEVRHSGRASLRLENFTANPQGQARVMQTVQVKPHRCYRIALWVKTEGLQPANALRVTVMTGERDLASREFHVPPSTDWQKLTMLFNSLDSEKVSVYAGLWGGKAGKVWLDDWSVEEVGPINVLHRPGTPVTVRSEDGAVVYAEGKDYAPLQDPNLDPWHDDREALALNVLSGGRIREGAHLRVSWYHSMVIDDSQVGVCMGEPALYEVFDREAKLLVEELHPNSVLLNMDEIRMGGTCQACRGRNMGELLGECITKEAAILRSYAPSLEIYIWSDMLDPNQSAHSNYYLVDGDFSGSWDHVPKNLIPTVRGVAPREASLSFFAGRGSRTLVAFDCENVGLKNVEGWLNVASGIRRLRGFMYMPRQQGYSLLPAFGDLLLKPGPQPAAGTR